MKTSIQLATFLLLASGVCSAAMAKLPAPSDEAKVAAAAAADKAGWANKVAAFKLCQVQDRVAARTVAQMRAAGKTVTPVSTAPCADPGPYVAADPAKKS